MPTYLATPAPVRSSRRLWKVAVPLLITLVIASCTDFNTSLLEEDVPYSLFTIPGLRPVALGLPEAPSGLPGPASEMPATPQARERSEAVPLRPEYKAWLQQNGVDTNAPNFDQSIMAGGQTVFRMRELQVKLTSHWGLPKYTFYFSILATRELCQVGGPAAVAMLTAMGAYVGSFVPVIGNILGGAAGAMEGFLVHWWSCRSTGLYSPDRCTGIVVIPALAPMPIGWFVTSHIDTSDCNYYGYDD